MSVVTTTILSEGQALDTQYDLLALDVVKEVNRIPYAQCVLRDGSAAAQDFPLSNTAFFEPGKTIEIKLRYEGSPESEATVFKGVVVGHRVEANPDYSVLTLELKDAAVKLTRTRKSAVYRDQTDDAILNAIVSDSGLATGQVAATQPEHPQIVQYYCTDWDFLRSRAEINGLLLVADNGEISLREVAIEGQASHSFTYGIDEIFSFEMEANAGYQYPDAESIGWDVKTQQLTQASRASDFSLSQGNLDGKQVAETIGIGTYTLTSAVPLNEQELQAWADATIIRSRMALLRGRITVRGIATINLLDVIDIDGIGERFNGTTLVTGIRQRLSINGWRTDVQFGLSPESFVERRDIVDVPAAGLLPGVNGLQIGLVDEFEEDPDGEFRVKVILPGIDAQEGALWARLATPDAGNARGFFFWPEPGDEVVVGFFNDDPRQAVILGALFSSQNTLPEELAAPSADNFEKGLVTRQGLTIKFVDDEKASLHIQTPQSNTIVLNDDAESIEITDQHGNSITMNQDGITITSAKDIILDASGNVEIKGSQVDIK